MKVYKFEGATNIRDIGGVYANSHIKEGMLIRGRAFLHLTEKDKKEIVDKYNVHTIIDLRSAEERDKEPSQTIVGAKYIPMAIFERKKDGISHTEKEKIDKNSVYRTLPPMKDIYFEFVHGYSFDNIVKVVQKIVRARDDEYGFYFHCSEGKDRTGVIAAILLMILGATRKEILKDYLLTNKVSNKKAFKNYMAIKYLKFQPRFALKVGRAFIAKKEYIEVLFNLVDKEYNGEEDFFLNGLKLTKEDLAQFRNRLLVK